jgi:hypothetical protein
MAKNYVQGIYEPLNKNKYKGSTPIIYRSSLEKRIFYLLDSNKNITQWGSESIVIPYVSPVDNKIHRYFVDLYFKYKDSNNNIVNYLVEIKPFKQTLRPVKTPRKRQKTFLTESYQWAVNQAKWDSATKWANKNGYVFKVITEKDMNLK